MVRGTEDKLFNTFIYIILGLVGLAAVVPLLYVVSVSLTPYGEVLRNGGYVLIPKAVTFQAYMKILSASDIWSSFRVTLFITFVGTAISLIVTMLLAYPLSRKGLPYRKWFLFMIVLTLLFSGGIIPTYLIVKNTGLLDTVWALILPNAIWSFNVLIMKSFFENLPEELFESARIDGAGEFSSLAACCSIVNAFNYNHRIILCSWPMEPIFPSYYVCDRPHAISTAGGGQRNADAFPASDGKFGKYGADGYNADECCCGGQPAYYTRVSVPAKASHQRHAARLNQRLNPW